MVNGAKAFITNSGTAITSVRHRHRPHRHRDDGRRDLDVHRARPARPGFTVEPAYDKLGWHASDTHGLTFDDCRVPEAQPARRARPGFAQFLAILDDGRIAIAALAVGCAQACLDESRRVRQDAHDVRRADRVAPGRRLPDRRPRGDRRGRAAADLPGGLR